MLMFSLFLYFEGSVMRQYVISVRAVKGIVQIPIPIRILETLTYTINICFSFYVTLEISIIFMNL